MAALLKIRHSTVAAFGAAAQGRTGHGATRWTDDLVFDRQPASACDRAHGLSVYCAPAAACGRGTARRKTVHPARRWNLASSQLTGPSAAALPQERTSSAMFIVPLLGNAAFDLETVERMTAALRRRAATDQTIRQHLCAVRIRTRAILLAKCIIEMAQGGEPRPATAEATVEEPRPATAERVELVAQNYKQCNAVGGERARGAGRDDAAGRCARNCRCSIPRLSPWRLFRGAAGTAEGHPRPAGPPGTARERKATWRRPGGVRPDGSSGPPRPARSDRIVGTGGAAAASPDQAACMCQPRNVWPGKPMAENSPATPAKSLSPLPARGANISLTTDTEVGRGTALAYISGAGHAATVSARRASTPAQ